MTARSVYWTEGMFLRPHHFQAAQRHLADLSRRNHSWDLHHNWGLRSLELDLEALANHRLVIHALEARLRDGSLVLAPLDGVLPAIDLRPAFLQKDTRSLMVYLAVPALYLGRRNVSLEANPDVRYLAQAVDLEDENTGANPQTVPLRALNVQILIGDQDQTGYEVLPVARIEKSAQADGVPQLDVSFIPPLLSCDAWPPLANGILRALCERLDKKIDWLVQQMNTQGVTFQRQAPGDAIVLKQLQQLNEASSVLDVLVAAPGVHPLWAFLELSRVVGQLAIFGATRQAPDIQRYNHDDLGTCFTSIKQHLDAMMDIVVEPEYKERPFIGAGLRMQVGLEPAWLDLSAQMFIGAQSSLEAGKTIDLLTKVGQLDMKVGSSDRVEDIFRQGTGGLRFVPIPLPPPALPKIAGQVYFQVIRNAKDAEWGNVEKSLALALRLNENLIVGNIQNQRRLTIKAGGKNVTMQFTLYVLPDKKA